ncbi:MAG TPA: CoA pyrophosphatase [Nitrososphaerales archaeon]|nr:CoA pyrophosphatase [Nitrososphaerales archaeon]
MDEKLDLQIDQVKSVLLERPGRRMPAGEADGLPEAAVCMVLRPDSQSHELAALFIKRKERVGDPWAGHVAFPGGRFVKTDQHLLSTVIREVLEETGIDLRTCAMLGTLDELVPGNRAIKVTPFVALAPEQVKVVPNEIEVSSHVWIPISFFMDRNNSLPYTIDGPGVGERRLVISFPFLGKYVVWGMTLRVMEDFLTKLYNH